MRNIIVGAATAASLLSAGLAAGAVQAEPAVRLIFAVERSGDQPIVQDAQFIFGGRSFCWYTGGWRGEGFYWCGYAWRSGLGWGGGRGWNGWRGGYANGWRGGRLASHRGYATPPHIIEHRGHGGDARMAAPAGRDGDGGHPDGGDRPHG